MTQPLVSVYLPTRNRSSLLTDAATSVLTQNFRDLELIIIDDGSTDETQKVVARLKQADRRIVAIRNSTSIGPSAARNMAIACARGEFVTGIDDDDLMLPSRLSVLLRAETPKFGLICSQFFTQHKDRRSRSGWMTRTVSVSKMLHYNAVGNQALMRVERVRKVGGFDPSLNSSEDYDLWLRIIEKYGSALKLGSATYIKREGIAENQLTNSAEFKVGAAAFTAKHAHKMNNFQLRSQKLIQKISDRSTITISEIPSVFSPHCTLLLIRYLISKALFKRTSS